MPEPKKLVPNGTIIPNENCVAREHKSRSKTKLTHQQQQNEIDISHEVARAVQSLRLDIERLTNKINSLEDSNRALAVATKKKGWFFRDLSPQLLAFLIVWPFLATFITNKFLVRRN